MAARQVPEDITLSQGTNNGSEHVKNTQTSQRMSIATSGI